RGRIAQLPPPLLAPHHNGTHRVHTAEKLGSLHDIARREALTNPRRRRPAPLTGTHIINQNDLKTVLTPRRPQRLNRAIAAMAVTKIAADENLACAQTVDQHPPHKIVRA